jgi:hypothetical protein
MKYIILSFDDGRKDTYDIAFKLLMKYDFTASIHITTGFIDRTIENSSDFQNIEAMSLDNVIEMFHSGFDISSHSDKHINEEEDLRVSLLKLKKWGLLQENNVVFSSPKSKIYEGNIQEYRAMLERNNVRLLRTGNQLKRHGVIYVLLYLLQRLFQSNILFYLLNKKNILNIDKYRIKNKLLVISATAVKYYNSIGQLTFFLKKIKDNEAVIFLFHSILYEKDILKKNKWAFTAEKFEELLKIFKSSKNIKVLNIKELFEYES